MTKADLVTKIASRSGVTKGSTSKVIRALASAAQELLREGQDVVLPGIGKIKRTLRAARTARNPRTGETVEVAERHVPQFKASPALKDAC